MSTMKITAITPWFGSKRSMAPVIAAEAGKHASWYEPFCGSMAVTFAKTPSRQECVNDLHTDLTNLARVVQRDDLAPALYDRAARTLYADDLYRESADWLAQHDEPGNEPDLDRAYHYFLASWMGRNGVSGTARLNYQKATRWTPGGGSGPTRWRNATDSIPAWHDRLRSVDILRRDGLGLIDSIADVADVVIYCDPPYLHAGRGGSRYEHEFPDHSGGIFGGADHHADLAERLGSFVNARVIVSYYADPRLEELYPRDRWTHLDCSRQKNLHVQNRRGAGECEAPEVLLINGPSYTEEV